MKILEMAVALATKNRYFAYLMYEMPKYTVEELELLMKRDPQIDDWQLQWRKLSKELIELVNEKWDENHDMYVFADNGVEIVKAVLELEITMYHDGDIHYPDFPNEADWFPTPKNWKEIPILIERVDKVIKKIATKKALARKKMWWPLLVKAWAGRLQVTIKRMKPVGKTKRENGQIVLPKSDKYVPINETRFYLNGDEVRVIGLRYKPGPQMTYAVLKELNKDGLHKECPADKLRSVYK